MPDQWLKAPVDNLAALFAQSEAVWDFLSPGGSIGNASEALAAIYKSDTSEGELPIVDISAMGVTLFVDGDVRNLIPGEYVHLKIIDSTGNDGNYVVEGTPVYAGGRTEIGISGALPSTTADGFVCLQQMPRLIVGSVGGKRRTKVATHDWETTAGQLFAVFQQQTAAAYWNPAVGIDDPAGAYNDFVDKLQDIMDDIEALAGTGGLLNVIEISEESPPVEISSDLNHGTPYWHMEFGLTFL